jgi:hypothetical protein
VRGTGTFFAAVIFSAFTISVSHSGATTYHSDGSAASVRALHNVAVNGDTITLPAGTFTWSRSVTISKAITLQGNGIGRTIIRDAVQTPGFCLRVNSPPGGVNRVTGIEFRDGGRITTTSAPNAVFKIFGDNTNNSATRVDHCKFYHLNGHVGTETAIGSVFDHCEFYFRGNTYLFASASDYDGGTFGDKSWTAPSGFGGPNFLFVEDCLLRNDDHFYACMDAFGGARYVIRHCRLVNTHPGGHGTEGQRARGVRAVEVYNNVMTHTLGGVVGNVRGGVQIYHNNRATGPSTVGIRLQYQRIFNNFTIWGRADGTSIYDVNQNGVVVHAIDQPGRAEGGLIRGANPPVLPGAWNDQVTDACYAWNNTYDGQPTRMYGEQPNIREGEHYFNSPKPGYAPYTYPHPLVSAVGAARATVTDFNGDDSPDFVIGTASTHRTAIWYLDNNLLIGSGFGPTLPGRWGLAAAADFNRDGHTDYALFNSVTGQTVIGYLSGLTVIGAAFGPRLLTGWELAAVADFNGDSKADYLLYKASTRQTAIWYLDDNVFINGGFGPSLPPGWSLIGAADFNRDGHPDYVLFNSATHQSVIGYLSGRTLIGAAFGPTITGAWRFVATDDFNSDGYPDYVLYNPATRQTSIWYLSDNVYVSSAQGPTLPTGWSLSAP